eukprot:SAG22_NODE_4149_length_1367_cov_3.360410_2_plen_70_part_00
MPTPEKLRKEYEKVIGESPDGRWGEARVQAAIDAAKAQRGPPGPPGAKGDKGDKGARGTRLMYWAAGES